MTDDIAAAEPPEEDDDLYLLRRELSLLAEKYRRATILYYIDRRSCADIAHTLAISESMVKYLLFKSRKILKEGMSMERKLGTLSYDPRSFVPMYNGSGPNMFWDFMQSKVRQNIVCACYNDSLTPEQISLETGIALPYLDEDIRAMVEKKLLIKEGKHYKANVLMVTADCTEEIARKAAMYHEKIADAIADFLQTKLAEFKQIGFVGADFSDNTLRWQMLTFVLTSILDVDMPHDTCELPQTGWGDYAYLWLAEEGEWQKDHLYNFSQETGQQGDRIQFYDYVPRPKGYHRDFFGNAWYTNLFCDIARGQRGGFGENDLLAIAEMVKKGYVLQDEAGFRVATPVFTTAQYNAAVALVQAFVDERLTDMLRELDALCAQVLREHTPKHLQPQVEGIAGMEKFIHAACIPTRLLLERGVLDDHWHPLEMPTTYTVLNS